MTEIEQKRAELDALYKEAERAENVSEEAAVGVRARLGELLKELDRLERPT